jgi:hypothetical protein
VGPQQVLDKKKQKQDETRINVPVKFPAKNYLTIELPIFLAPGSSKSSQPFKRSRLFFSVGTTSHMALSKNVAQFMAILAGKYDDLGVAKKM